MTSQTVGGGGGGGGRGGGGGKDGGQSWGVAVSPTFIAADTRNSHFAHLFVSFSRFFFK